MIELEAKVWLEKQGFDPSQLLKDLYSKSTFVAEKSKYDYYFQKKGETDPSKLNFRLRVQSKNGKEIFIANQKKQDWKNGIESNHEVEFEVSSKESFFEFVEALGYVCSFEKGKETTEFEYKGFTIEFNKMPDLGYFLEIEKICEEDCDLEKEKNQLTQVFADFGFTQDQFETTRYVELLQEVRK